MSSLVGIVSVSSVIALGRTLAAYADLKARIEAMLQVHRASLSGSGSRRW